MHFMQDKLLVRLHPELKRILGEAADREQVFGGMGELAVRIMASYFKRPDLAYVPRKQMGRPRKDAEQRNGKRKAVRA